MESNVIRCFRKLPDKFVGIASVSKVWENSLKATHYSNSFMTEVLIYGNQSIDLLCKSLDWFLYDRDLRHEIFKT